MKREYTGRDNYGRPKMDFVNRLRAMSDEDLFEETTKYIWMSGYANNNPRSDYHWMAGATYDEWGYRKKPGEYTRAYDQVHEEANR